MERSWNWRGAVLLLAMLWSLAGGAWAEDQSQNQAGDAEAAAEAEQAPDSDASSDDDRIAELEAKVDVLASELSKAVADETVPEEKLESTWGFGPAASKIYRKDHGLSIGGYGEYRVRTFVEDGSDGKSTEADALRAVLYVGYKFSDKWLVNSEFEFEHASSSGGSVSVEFANIDWQATEDHGMRVGLLLVPMGFVNEIHEPTFFFGAERPEVEKRIIPTTWREVGGGIFGQFADGRVSYRMFGISGMDATGYAVDGLRGGRQKGSKALADHWAFVGRTDVNVVDGLTLGGSVYVGPSGQNQTYDHDGDGDEDPAPGVPTPEVDVPDALTTVYELHAEYKAFGASVRGLFTQAFVKDAGELNTALGNGAGEQVASRMLGAYGEIGYDVMPLFFESARASVEPFFRYERLDTQNQMSPTDTANQNYVRDIYTVGLHIKPIENVVFKVDYRNIKPKTGVVANQVQFGAGYVF